MLAAHTAAILLASGVIAPPAATGADALAPFAIERIGAPRNALPLPADCAAVCVLSPAAGEVLPGIAANRAELRFVDGLLHSVDVVFDEARYAAAIEGLQSRFGPGEDRHYRARAGMGAAELVAGVMLWRRADLVIVAEQFAGRISRSRLRYGTPAAMRELLEEITARPVGARRDL